MAIDRHGTGLAVLRICLGLFFVFEGLGKVRWLTDSSILAGQLAGWSAGVGAGSLSAWYLHHIAIPGIPLFARLVPLGEFISGLALICGFWTPFFGFVTFLMALNFHIAGGTIFRYAFLTNGYGLPVLGGTLALALGGTRLPWSIR